MPKCEATRYDDQCDIEFKFSSIHTSDKLHEKLFMLSLYCIVKIAKVCCSTAEFTALYH